MLKESLINIADNVKAEDKESKDRLKEALELQPYILGNIKILEDYRNNSKVDIKKTQELFNDLCKYFELCGAEMTSNVSDVYNKYIRTGETLAVRRESPESLVKIAAGEEKKMYFDPKVVADRGDKYANCAIWPYGQNPVAGITNAFLEGKTFAGPIVSLMAVNLRNDNLTIEEPKDKMMHVGNINRESVKILDGVVKKEDLEFIILRLPYKFFPKELLTGREIKEGDKAGQEERVLQIFRAFVFKK